MDDAAGMRVPDGDARIRGPMPVAGARPRAGRCGLRCTASAGGPARDPEPAGHRVPRRLSRGRGEPGSRADATGCGHMLTEAPAPLPGPPFCSPRRCGATRIWGGGGRHMGHERIRHRSGMDYASQASPAHADRDGTLTDRARAVMGEA